MHDKLQLLPEARGDEQGPTPPFAGGDTVHDPAAFTEIGMPSSAAASHQISLAFMASIGAKGPRTKSSTFIIKPDDHSFLITVPFLIRLKL